MDPEDVDVASLQSADRSASFELSDPMIAVIGTVGLVLIVLIIACCCMEEKKQQTDKGKAFAEGAVYGSTGQLPVSGVHGGVPMSAVSGMDNPMTPGGRSHGPQLSMNMRSPPPFSAPPFDSSLLSYSNTNPAGSAAMLTPTADASYLVGQAPGSPGLNRFFPGGNSGAEAPSLWAVAAETHI